MNKLFPTYEVGSLPKLNARVKAARGQEVSEADMQEVIALASRFSVDHSEVLQLLEKTKTGKLDPEEVSRLVDFNALLFLRIQEGLGLDVVYDGEARRAEMYQHVAQRIEGFQVAPEMVRSRGPDSWRMAICVAPPKLKEDSIDDLVGREFLFVKKQARHPVKIPVDDPYMIAVMSDNRYYTEKLREKYFDDPKGLRYEAKREFVLALARDVIRPQVETLTRDGAQWIQLDIPAATLDLEHIPIVIEGVNAVVENIEGVKFSLHLCYPRRLTLTEKNGYELLFPSILDLNPSVDHLSLELANADQYEKDLAIFARYRNQRAFELGVGVINITLEQQQRGTIETPEVVRERILRATKSLGDPELVYVAPDCGLRQLQLDRCLRLYETMINGAELARRG